MYEDYDFLTVEQSDLDKFESVVAEDDIRRANGNNEPLNYDTDITDIMKH